MLGLGTIAPVPAETEQLVHSSCAERFSDTSLANEMQKTASRSFPVNLICLICARRCVFPAHWVPLSAAGGAQCWALKNSKAGEGPLVRRD